MGYSSFIWAYRPFVSTDAAVAGPQEIELELGYFTLKRAEQKNSLVTPQVVVNYGLTQRWEVVGEFEIEEPPDNSIQLVDPGLFLKAILKEGILQNKNGMSFAVEAGPLLPSTLTGERRLGFEGIGIVSGRLAPFLYHINLGGGVDRAKTNPFVLWGVIVEVPISAHLRLVGEVNGESVRKELLDESALWGFSWQLPTSPILLDVGIRRRISRGAPEWQFTTGLTWSFPLPFATTAATSRGNP